MNAIQAVSRDKSGQRASGSGIATAADPDGRTLAQFRMGWVLLFVGLAAYQYGFRGRAVLGFGLASLGIAGALLGWRYPRIFARVYGASVLVTKPVGWLVSHVALAVMFYAVLTPLALFFRAGGRDRLRRFKPEATPTFWLQRKPAADRRRYLRPY